MSAPFATSAGQLGFYANRLAHCSSLHPVAAPISAAGPGEGVDRAHSRVAGMRAAEQVPRCLGTINWAEGGWVEGGQGSGWREGGQVDR